MKKASYLTHEIVSFKSAIKGPHLLILGGIHGNETCGSTAIRTIIDRMQKGTLKLLKGSVTFVPMCNPLAQIKKTRFIEKNLNRVIAPLQKPKGYEEKLAQNILSLIDGCDWLLDLHSYSSAGPAFVFQDYADKKTERLAMALGIPAIVKGWPQMYATKEAAGLNEGDTTSYAHSKRKPAVVLECGQHGTQKAHQVACKAILSALVFLGMITPPKQRDQTLSFSIVTGTQIVIKSKKGNLVKQWRHFDPIQKGEVIAIYADGSEEKAPYNGVILLPHNECKIGTEWFYYGR